MDSILQLVAMESGERRTSSAVPSLPRAPSQSPWLFRLLKWERYYASIGWVGSIMIVESRLASCTRLNFADINARCLVSRQRVWP